MGLIKLLQALNWVIADVGTVFDHRCEDQTAVLYRVWQSAFHHHVGSGEELLGQASAWGSSFVRDASRSLFQEQLHRASLDQEIRQAGG